VRTSREGPKEALDILSECLLEAVEGTLLSNAGVPIGRDQKSKSGVNAIYKIVEQSSCLPIHCKRIITRGPFPHDNVYIQRRLVQHVNIVETPGAPGKYVVDPCVLIADGLDHN